MNCSKDDLEKADARLEGACEAWAYRVDGGENSRAGSVWVMVPTAPGGEAAAVGEGNLVGKLNVSGEGAAVEGGWEGAGQESEAIGPGEETGRWGAHDVLR